MIIVYFFTFLDGLSRENTKWYFQGWFNGYLNFPVLKMYNYHLMYNQHLLYHLNTTIAFWKFIVNSRVYNLFPFIFFIFSAESVQQSK